MNERRIFPRFTLDVEVYWKKITHEDDLKAQHISHVKDVSLGGVCLVLHSGIIQGDILELDIELLDKKRIHCKGKVVWIDLNVRLKGRKEPVVEGGVEFLDMSEEDKKIAGHYITHTYNYPGGTHK